MICDLKDCEGEILSVIVSCSKGHRYMKRVNGEIIQLADEVQQVETPPVRTAKLAIPGSKKIVPTFMPFGKHKGTRIDELPTDYLVWMAENLGDKPELQQEAENQLRGRSGKGIEW